MKRALLFSLISTIVAAMFTVSVTADVKTREKSLIKFEGMLGRVVGMFGGKSARDGVVSSAAVKGNRKAMMGDANSQIIDLGEEKVYDLDMRKKEYKVTTFDELRRRMREAQERAQSEAQREEPQQKAEKPSEPQKELEVDFDAKETGQRRQIAGYDARQVIMTVTVREKGKALDESGGLVMTADSWLGPEIAALKELADFDMRYYTKLYGATSMGLAAEQMAMVMAMYPGLKAASERLRQEGDKLKGTPLATTTTFEAVKSKAAMEEQGKQKDSGGGLGGMLARRMMKKEDPKQRATIFTIQHEYQEVSANASAADVEIPAGFKEKK
jgi:hypothetical protein